MTDSIRIINEDGRKTLYGLAASDPGLFLEPDTDRLRRRMEHIAQTADLFADDLIINCSIDELNTIASRISDSEPSGSDAYFSQIIREAFSDVTPRQAVDGLLWASANCFAIPDYVPVRWPTKNLKKGGYSDHVKSHWLNAGSPGREKNSTARLWWLGEIAKRSAPFSEHDYDTLRITLANHPSFYHRLLYRPLILRMPRLAAAICDLALSGNEHLFQHKHIDILVNKLLDIAANTSLDLMPDDELLRLVRDNAPKKVRGGSK